MSSIVAHIMTRDLRTLPSTATLKDAHQLIEETSLRHIPVLERGHFRGVLTQKKIIAKVMTLMKEHGLPALEEQEAAIPVTELLDSDCHQVQPTEPLANAIDHFANNRHGCLPVVDHDGVLQGIVTSADFVRLCARLLDHRH